MAKTTKKTAASRSQAKRTGEISDEAVRKATGKTQSQWFAILDKSGARQMSHTEIARHLYEKHEVSGWWSQMVTVAYERKRGLRRVNQRPGGLFYASVSRTLAAPLSDLFEAWKNPRQRSTWLKRAITVRTATPNKSMRITWSDGKSSVEVYFLAKGAGKSQVTVQHEKLPSEAHIARTKTFWAKTLEKLKSKLEA
ncbi:MAG TPA: SRPBCC domain-containing protein [Candidatus Limnocylindria bacterium]|nr:SRPBCC domain-containing protein [Candidatus Limnocylindria bacterium]